MDPATGIFDSIRPEAVEALLDEYPESRAVVLTSPTYEGVVSDIASIAQICHAHGVPLLVDEAHGAHYLPFAEPLGWQGGAVAAGADVVVQSAHKTLPSNPPIAPATVFFGDIDGQSFLFPKVLPTRYANVSENTGRKIANDIANVPPHGNSLESANASDTSAIG